MNIQHWRHVFWTFNTKTKISNINYRYVTDIKLRSIPFQWKNLGRCEESLTYTVGIYPDRGWVTAPGRLGRQGDSTLQHNSLSTNWPSSKTPRIPSIDERIMAAVCCGTQPFTILYKTETQVKCMLRASWDLLLLNEKSMIVIYYFIKVYL